MLRRFLVIGLCALAVACQSQKDKKSGSGPVVAKGTGVTITADEFKARLDEQSPFIRARYSTLERKKEFLDNLVRFEVLAREAEKQGLNQVGDLKDEWTESLRSTIRQHPIAAITTALAVGVILSRLTSSDDR